ncbi:MAG: CopG family transcriptional regulator [Betaproteobacteria bacterium]|nr:CopG family transcriptional regulator [Betaproteobacteria bacterium]
MTTTVKLPEPLEAALRQRCLQEGRSISEVIRDALSAYLAKEAELDSAWQLGRDVFGRHAGPAELASARKRALAEVWEERHAARGA